MGSSGGGRRNGGVPGLARLGLRDRHDDSRRWRICDPLTLRSSRATKPPAKLIPQYARRRRGNLTTWKLYVGISSVNPAVAINATAQIKSKFTQALRSTSSPSFS